MEIAPNQLDVSIEEKLRHHPILGRWRDGGPLLFSREFISASEQPRFNSSGDGLIVYQAHMFEQFNSNAGKPQHWITLEELRKTRFYASGDWAHYRLAIRHNAKARDGRTLISSILPCNSVASHSVLVNVKDILPPGQALYLVGMLNSFVLDFLIRWQVTSNVTLSAIHQLPVPCLKVGATLFRLVAERSARLICTAPEFDDLACEIGLKGHTDGVTNLFERSQLRAELDGLIAHLYGLTESEFVRILSTFPLIAEPIKVAAQNAYRDVARGLIK